MANRNVPRAAIPITNPNKPVVEPNGKDAESPPDASPTSNGVGTPLNHPSATVAPDAPRPTFKPPENTWNSLDMGGLNLKNLPQSSGLFAFTFLTSLYLNHNNLSIVPPQIAKLRHLKLLDLSANNLASLPPELGMLTQLKELYLYDNQLPTLPHQLGTLHQLQTLGIEGNPLDAEIKTILQKDGTTSLIAYLRDSCPVVDPPPQRTWNYLITQQERDAMEQDPYLETFTVLSYNILCEKYATERLYGYTPAWALPWNYRKELILTELLNSDADFLCLQEVAIAQYEDYFFPRLREHGYMGAYWPKSRAKTMSDVDRRLVDGCATFYKSDKYVIIIINYPNSHFIQVHACGEASHRT